MTPASAIKSAFSVAWVLSGVSPLMISDDYRGGYKRMAGYAVVVFVAGLLVGSGGLLAATVWQRGKVSAWWLIAGGFQVFASLAVVTIVVLINLASQ
jgi:hypothetical protein